MPLNLSPKTLAMLGLGGLAGGVVGRHVTPGIFGYEGDRAATNLSTLIDASAGVGLAALLRNPKALQAILAEPMSIPAGVGALAMSETLPVATHAIGRGTAAANTLSRTRLLDQLREVAGTPAARGVGIGAAGAGLAALASGMMRPKSPTERGEDTSRGSMVTSDFLKYLIPAMIAGGLGGQLLDGGKKRR